MRTVVLAVVGVIGLVLSSCGGDIGLRPSQSQTGDDDGSAAGAKSVDESAGASADVDRRSPMGTGGRREPGSSSVSDATDGGSSTLRVSNTPDEPSEPKDVPVLVDGGVGGGTSTGGRTSVIGVGATGSRVGSVGIPVPNYIGGSSGYSDAPPPENCEPSGESASDEYCQTALTCTNDYVYTYCYDQGNDGWSCDCSSNYRYQSYEIVGADSSSACKAVSQLCSAAEQPEFTEPETCSTEYQAQDTSYCEIQEACTQSTEVGGGITAILRKYKYANCSEDDGRMLCGCSDNTTSRTYEIAGMDGTSSCQLAQELCDSDEDLVFDGPETCDTEYQDASGGYCDIELQCLQSTQVRGDVTALLYDWRYANCQNQPDGSSLCYCSDNESSLTIGIPGSTTLDTCRSSLDVCANKDEIVLAGDIVCERAYQSASSQYCDAQITCNQPATQGDRELLVHGDLYVNCQQQTADSPWSCTCASGPSQATGLEIDADEGWEACTMAADRCPTLVEVQLGGTSDGSSGIIVPGPIPL